MAKKTKTNKKFIYSRHVSTKFGLRWVHHRHTGRKLPVNCTSYAVLFFLLALTGSALIFATQVARADQSAQGSIDLSGKVSGPAPTVAAVITDPTEGQRFDHNIIPVSGTCDPGLLIELYRYDIFAGSAICSSQGRFDITITLIEGANDLRARSKDGEGRYAPDSAVVTVYYDVPAAKRPPAGQRILPFLIYTDPVQRGVQLADDLDVKYELDGGRAPYAISIKWQDGSTDSLYSHSQTGDYTGSHLYARPGQYTLGISGTDSLGNQAFIQTIAVAQGTSEAIGSAAANNCTAAGCIFVDPLVRLVESFWPAFIIACLMTASFWAGEKVIYNRLGRRAPAR